MTVLDFVALAILLLSGGASGACIVTALHTPISLRDLPTDADAPPHPFGDLMAQLDRIPY